MGLAGSIAVLRAIEATHHPENIVPTWALLQVGCLCLYQIAVHPCKRAAGQQSKGCISCASTSST